MKFYLILISFFLLNIPLHALVPITECDKYVADPDDINKPENIIGVYYEDIIANDFAVAACLDAVNNYPNEKRFNYQLGLIYSKQEKEDLALEQFYLSTDINKPYPGSYFEIGYIFRLREQHNKAIENFQRAVELNYLPIISKTYMAEGLYLSEKYNEAEKIYSELLKIYKDRNFELGQDNNRFSPAILEIIHVDLATIHENKKSYKKAITILNNLITNYEKWEDPLHKYYQENYEFYYTFSDIYKWIADDYIALDDGLSAVYNYEKSLEYDSNDLDALINLGWIYDGGEGGIAQNYQKARELYELAAELEDPLALNNLALMYEEGKGVEIDYDKAKEFYEKSYSLKTSALSFYNLAYFYTYGYGSKIKNNNPTRAREIITEFLNIYKESGYATFDEAKEYVDDALEDIKLLLSDIESDNLVEKFPLGLEQQCSSLEADIYTGSIRNELFQKCLKLAEAGNIEIINIIADFYKRGIMVKQNHQESAKWYMHAINQKYTDDYHFYNAIFNLSKLSINGYYKLDYPVTNLLDNLLNSSDFKSEANFMYGLIYRYGIEKEINYDRSIEYFNRVILSEIQNLSVKAEDNINAIKSIKAGYAVEKNIIDYFPSTFSGVYAWNSILVSENQIIDEFKVDKISRLGPDRYRFNGLIKFDDGISSEFQGFLDSRLNNFEFKESNPKDEQGRLLEDGDYVLNGLFKGFFTNNYEEINGYFIPDHTEDIGLLSLKLSSERKNLNKVETLPLNFGNYHALVIGNNDYINNASLNMAILDADAVANVLRNKYGFEVTVIKNGTRRDILSTLNSFKKTLKREDNLLIYYAGHGAVDEAKRGYWLPVDADNVITQDTTQWISNDDISNILSRIKSNHILVIADSCFSGSLTTRGSDANLSNDDKVNIFKNMIDKKTRRALTSGANEPVLDSGGDGHSIFADSFLKILSNVGTPISTGDIYSQLSPMVSSRADQSPQYGVVQKSGHDGGDFIFVPIN